MSDKLKKHENFDKWFDPCAALQAEGARVGITNCKVCGAAVLIDPRNEVDYARLHAQWHQEKTE